MVCMYACKICFATAFNTINTSDIATALQPQKKGKVMGHDGIAMEAFINGSNKLLVHLAILFTMFVDHRYVPGKLLHSIIIPLVKCKGGELADVNNYRAITLSNSVISFWSTKSPILWYSAPSLLTHLR